MLTQIRNRYQKAVGVLRNEEGQGLVEYALILVLIAVVVIAAVITVGTSTSSTFTQINGQMH